MYKYLFIICILIPFEIYGYSLKQTDIDKIKKTFAESTISSICLKECQKTLKKPKAVNKCKNGCLDIVVNRSIDRLKFNAKKFRKKSVKHCTAQLKITFPGESLKPTEFNKLVQKCVDQNVSTMMTETINDLPSIINDDKEIQAAERRKKAKPPMSKQLQTPIKSTKKSQ